MHIHGSSMNTNSINPYSAAAEKAVAAQRAAGVRKRLLKKASSIESAAEPVDPASFSQWMNFQHSRVMSGDDYKAGGSGKDSNFS
jgi:hypothetical protein